MDDPHFRAYGDDVGTDADISGLVMGRHKAIDSAVVAAVDGAIPRVPQHRATPREAALGPAAPAATFSASSRPRCGLSGGRAATSMVSRVGLRGVLLVCGVVAAFWLGTAAASADDDGLSTPASASQQQGSQASNGGESPENTGDSSNSASTEERQSQPDSGPSGRAQDEPEPESQRESEAQPDPEPAPETESQSESEAQADPEPAPETELQPEPKAQPDPEPVLELAPDAAAEGDEQPAESAGDTAPAEPVEQAAKPSGEAQVITDVRREADRTEKLVGDGLNDTTGVVGATITRATDTVRDSVLDAEALKFVTDPLSSDVDDAMVDTADFVLGESSQGKTSPSGTAPVNDAAFDLHEPRAAAADRIPAGVTVTHGDALRLPELVQRTADTTSVASHPEQPIEAAPHAGHATAGSATGGDLTASHATDSLDLAVGEAVVSYTLDVVRDPRSERPGFSPD